MRVTVALALTLIALALTGYAGVIGPTTEGKQGMAQPRKIPVATIYYQWYGYEHNAGAGWPATGGLGTFHWNDVVFDQLVTGYVANRPEIGYYASDDVDTIAWQLEQMQEAGIDTLIVSWWGWGDANLDGTADDNYIEARSHDALIKLLDYIKDNNLKFKVALMVEPWMDVIAGAEPGTAKNLSDAQKQMILDWVWDNVYSVYPNQIFQWQGKPLLCAVGELYFAPAEDEANRYTLRSFRFKDSDVDPGNAWDWDISKPLPYSQTVDDTVILSPRYDEWFLDAAHPDWWEAGAWGRTDPVRHDPYLKENLYDFEWRQVYNQRADVDLVILWAWNSRMEQLYIEPDDGAGAAPAGDSLVRKTNWYVRRLLNGSPFQMFEPDWVTVQDVRSILNPINPEQLNLESDAEVDQLLERIIRRAQGHVEGYLNRSYGVTPAATVAADAAVGATSIKLYPGVDLIAGDMLQLGLGSPLLVQAKEVTAPVTDGDPHTLALGLSLTQSVSQGTPVYQVTPPYTNVADLAPEGVREVTLRVAAAIYNYMIATKAGNLVQFGERGVDVLSNTVFTNAMRRDLAPYRKASGVTVLWP